MDANVPTSEAQAQPTAEHIPAEPVTSDGQMRIFVIVGAVTALLIVAGVVGASFWMLGHPAETETLRDIFIIWMAFLALLIGAALIILSVQVARLINLLQNEIKPILENTNETVNTVRGTAMFVSENITEPVVKLSSTVAGVQRFLQLLTPARPKRTSHRHVKGEHHGRQR